MATGRTTSNSRSGRSAMSSPFLWKRACLTVALLLIPVILSACVFRKMTFNEPIHADDVAFIVDGNTTLPEVVARFGAPDEIVGIPDQAIAGIARYRFRVAKSVGVNFGWILRFWSPVSPAMAMNVGSLGTDVFQVTFDQHWVVKGHAFSYHTRDVSFTPWPF